MRHDVLILLVRQSPRFVEHALTNADLADVVDVTAKLDLTDHLGVDVERARDDGGVLAHAYRMAARVRVFYFERLGERLDAGEEQLLQAARLLRHAFLEPLLVVAIL